MTNPKPKANLDTLHDFITLSLDAISRPAVDDVVMIEARGHMRAALAVTADMMEGAVK